MGRGMNDYANDLVYQARGAESNVLYCTENRCCAFKTTLVSSMEAHIRAYHPVEEGKKVNTTASVNVSGAGDVSGVEMHKIAQPKAQKPAVTAEQYARGREVLDALPPGIYLKCSKCKKWQQGGEITFASGDQFLCEGCA